MKRKRTKFPSEVLPTKKTSLTIKQTLFIDAYMYTKGNGVQSARLAGYSGEYFTLAAIAAENLKKPKIFNELQERFNNRGTIADAEENAETLSSFARNNNVEEVFNPVTEQIELIRQVPIKQRISAIQELNKMSGVHVRNININGKVDHEYNIKIDLDNMTEEEIDVIAAIVIRRKERHNLQQPNANSNYPRLRAVNGGKGTRG